MSDNWTVSASQIKKYQACPKQYEYAYIEREDPLKKSAGYMELGTAVHEILEVYLDPNTPRPGGVDGHSASQIEEYLKDEYYQVNDEVPGSLDKRAEECIEGAARYLSKFDTEIEEVEMEEFFELGTPPSSTRAIGIMDVVTKDGEIWDWKTGKDIRGFDDTIQAGTYMEAYKSRFGKYPTVVKFVYVLRGEIEKYTPDGTAIQTALSGLGTLKRGRIVGEYPATPEEGTCTWCPYEWLCNASPVGFGQLEWEDWQ